jgi:hypothetical protein
MLDARPGMVNDTLEDAALAANAARRRFMLAGEYDAHVALLSERMVFVHGNGVVEDKTAYVDRLRAGDFVYRSIESEDVRLIAAGEAVVMSERRKVVVCPPQAETPLLVDSMVIQVWAMEEGVMRLLSYQGTFCADPKPVVEEA